MVTDGLCPPARFVLLIMRGRGEEGGISGARRTQASLGLRQSPFQHFVPIGTVWPPLGDSTPGGESGPLGQADTWQGSDFLDRMAARSPEAAALAEHRIRGGRAHPGIRPRSAPGAAAADPPPPPGLGSGRNSPSPAPRPPPAGAAGRSRPPVIRDAPRGSAWVGGGG